MRRTIVCFGDSNTWGYNAENGKRFNENDRWTGLLSKKLGDSFRLVEEGLCGRTSVCDDPLFEGLAGISYIAPCLMSHSPIDLVIIMLGTNDTKERFSLTSYNIAQGIARLAHKAKSTTAGIDQGSPEVLVIAPPAIGEKYIETDIGKPMGRGCSEKSFELGEHMKSLLTGTNIHFADAKDHVTMNCIDYMHLDEEGHKAMAEFIYNQVVGLLPMNGSNAPII